MFFFSYVNKSTQLPKKKKKKAERKPYMPTPTDDPGRLTLKSS